MSVHILRDVRKAFQNLNPGEVRELAERPLRIGVLAVDDAIYARALSFLIPTHASDAKAAQAARCVARLPRVSLRGTNISRVAVFVDGRLVRRVRGRLLQRRLTVSRLGRVAPGPHRVVTRVRFRLGSGTSPLTLVRRVRICRALLPRFTG